MRKLAAFLACVLVGMFPVSAAWAAHASPGTVEVDSGSCPGPGSGTAADPFCELADALLHSGAGDTILVNSGSFDVSGDASDRNWETYSPVTLRGEVSGSVENYDTFKALGAEIVNLDAEIYASLEISGGAVSGRLDFERYAPVAVSGVSFSGAGVKVSYDPNALMLNLGAIIAANTWKGTPQIVGTTIVLTPPPSPSPPPSDPPDPPEDKFLRMVVGEGVDVEIVLRAGWYWSRRKSFGPGTYEIRFLDGSRPFLRVSADVCHKSTAILVDGKKSDGEIFMNRDRNAEILVQRKKIPVTLSHSGNGTGKTDPPPGTYEVPCGGEFRAEASPNPLSEFLRFTISGELQGRNDPVVVHDVREPVFVEAVFRRTIFRVLVRGGKGGNVEQEGAHLVSPEYGLLLHAFPDPGFLCRWKGPVGTDSERCMTFVIPDRDLEVEAEFYPKPIPPFRDSRVTIRAHGAGLVLSMPFFLWRQGEDIPMVAIPLPGGAFDRWVVNGNDWVGIDPFFSVPNDGRDWDIIAVFK